MDERMNDIYKIKIKMHVCAMCERSRSLNSTLFHI